MRTCSAFERAWPLLPILMLVACSEASPSFTLGGYRYSTDALTRWALPRGLREISGLALGPDGRLFAHGDEVAIVFELDYRAGRVVKRFALGDPPRPGDYEGIAWAGDMLYLVTSDGDLLAAHDVADGGHADFRLYHTGLGRRCEIEGLDYDPDRRLLLMACKTAREHALEGRIAVLAWSLDRASAAPDDDLIAPPPDAEPMHTHLNPSGLARSPANGNLILVAARQHALIEVTPAGEVVHAFRPPGHGGHPQMEGLAITATGDLVIGDEGKEKRGHLSVYAAEQ